MFCCSLKAANVRPAPLVRLLFEPVQIKFRRLEGGDFSFVSNDSSEIYRYESGTRSGVETSPSFTDTQTIQKFSRDRSPHVMLKLEPFKFLLIYAKEIIVLLTGIRH